HAGSQQELYQETLPLRTFLVVKRLAREEDWTSLLAHLHEPRGEPQTSGGRERGYAEASAARALAGRCEATTPLLTAALADAKDQAGQWLEYALGLCGTEP